jgi:hypothetical protein
MRPAAATSVAPDTSASFLCAIGRKRVIALQ